MALRQAITSSRSILRNIRHFSTNPKFVDVSLNDLTGVATVALNRPPVNSFNLEFLNELITVQNDLEKQRVAGMILTSSSENIFSAGLDLTEVYKPNRERLLDFWKTIQEYWIVLYSCSFPSVALITGHAPAGGCVIAMACEYRIMFNNFTIGLSETRLGIPIPIWPSLNLENIIGRRNAELALTAGRIFTTEEAHKVGLVDEVVSNKADGLTKAENYLKRFTDVIPIARAYTKRDIRARDVEALKSIREKEQHFMVGYLMQPKFQSKLEMYLATLKNKS